MLCQEKELGEELGERAWRKSLEMSRHGNIEVVQKIGADRDACPRRLRMNNSCYEIFKLYRLIVYAWRLNGLYTKLLVASRSRYPIVKR